MQYRKIAVKESTAKIKSSTGDSLLDELLSLRNIKSKDEINKYLNPSKKDFISPYAFCDMEKAKKRIFDAIEKKQTILIWGDFDCDGVTSTTILYKTLNKLSANVITFIPNRQTMGHGLNSKELIKLVSKQKVKLLITVDCATSNTAEINLLSGLGVDTIITDHHAIDGETPRAYCVINPQVKGALDENLSVCEISSLSNNSGSVVAYKLAAALLENIDDENLKDELLIIAASGAVADVVSLTGENRSIVSCALELLNSKKELSQKGIYKLLSNNIKDREITSTDIAFILAPRINAVGRLANASLSFDFLNSDDDNKLSIMIEKLDNYNSIRQAKCQETYEEVLEYLKNNPQEKNNSAIILFNSNWHIGIIGIVASKIVEEFNKPCFLMTKDENNNARCSIRSNDLINVYEVLKENEELFSGFGGHKLAGGCSFGLDKTAFEDVKTALLKTIDETKEDKNIENVLYADVALEADEIELNIIDTINKLEPFGQSNEAPLFAAFGVIFEEFKLIGKEQNHMRLVFSFNGKKLSCVKWGENEILIPLNSKCDIAFYPRLNVFQDVQSIQLEIVDIYSDSVLKQKDGFKIFDHRKKTGILDQISSYLERDGLDICIWAKNPLTKEKLSHYQKIEQNFITQIAPHKGIMFFDYPSDIDEFNSIISQIKPLKIHFMNYNPDENLENYVKQISGMVKYCSNKLNGKIDMQKIAQATGVSENFIQITLEIMENIESIKMQDIDKVEYIKPFNFETFKNESLYKDLQEEFSKILNFKKSLMSCEIKEIENLISNALC